MRAVLFAVTLLACRPPEPVAPAAGGVTRTAGAALRPGTLRHTDVVELELAVVLPEGADVEQLESDVDSSVQVSRRTLEDVFKPAQREELIERRSDLEQLAIRRSPVVLALRRRAPAGSELVGSVAGAARSVASTAGGWVADPEQQFLWDAPAFETHMPATGTDVRTMIAFNSAWNGRVMYLRTAGMRRYGYFDLYIAAIDPKQRSPLFTLLAATAQHLVSGGDVDAHGQLVVDLAALGWGEKLVGGSGRGVWNATWGRLPTGEQVIELVPADGSAPDDFSVHVIGGH